MEPGSEKRERIQFEVRNSLRRLRSQKIGKVRKLTAQLEGATG